MKGIIWGSSITRAQDQLKTICYEYKILGIKYKQEKHSYYMSEVIFENGDLWIALKACEGARGYRCNISYIDELIDDDIVDRIIRPITCALPFNGIKYFYSFVT